MAKKVKSKKKSTTKKAKKSNGTIAAQVISILEGPNSDMKNADMVKQVISKHPDRAFNANHASWYRSQFKAKALAGQKGYKGPKRKSKKTATKKKTAKKKTVKRKKVKKAVKKAA